ncbi:MAG: Na/Pi cotransporter family protein, partial [Gemmatimonadetes bacterium]|nr:Na/Pi cotransporter family protein [Gemmatimonadota bacterium]
SSSVTTVLVVGFISAGLMSMAQSIGVIMGANIGTTVTAQIIAFKVTEYALLLVAVGFALTFLAKREIVRRQGAGLLGLGLVFFGMAVMGDAMGPLRDYPPFLAWMGRMARPELGILAGALFTALVQSSSATTGVVIVMASQGFITLPAGIALIFGANIGTCVTALLAAIGRPREALRASAVHVVFNIAGVLLWLPFIDYLATAVTRISLGADTARQIANAHTLFNIGNTLVFIWFVPLFARLVEWLVPDRPLAEEDLVRARYLDVELLQAPSLALDRARLEILRMGDRVREMITGILPAMTAGEAEDLDAVEAMDDAVDALHGQIITYLGKISQTSLTEGQTQEFVNLMEAVNDLENIGDIIETNLVTLGRHRIEEGVQISAPTLEVIERFHTTVLRSFDYALQAVTQENEEAAREVRKMKQVVNQMAEEAALHKAQRLVAPEPNRLATYALETDQLESLKRIFYFCKRMARGVIPGAVGIAAD